MAAIDLLQRIGDFSDRRLNARGLDGAFEQVAGPWARRTVSALKAGRDLILVAPALQPREPCRTAVSLTARLSTSRIAISASLSERYLSTPTMDCSSRVDAALRCGRGLLDAHLGQPASMAFAMPPIFSTSR